MQACALPNDVTEGRAGMMAKDVTEGRAGQTVTLLTWLPRFRATSFDRAACSSQNIGAYACKAKYPHLSSINLLK
jgi:hypothetical protein